MALGIGHGSRGGGAHGGAVLRCADRMRLLRALWLARAAQPGGRPAAPLAPRLDAIAVGAAAALGPNDRLCAPGRYLGAHLTRAAATAHPSAGLATDAADLAAVAVGVALAGRLRGEDTVTMALLDEGALGAHRWPELIAQAADDLARVLVVDCGREDVRPGGVEPVDGLDVEAVLAAARIAVAEARAGRCLRAVSCLRPAPAVDPLRAYVRRLRGIGFPRGEIEAVGRTVAAEVAR